VGEILLAQPTILNEWKSRLLNQKIREPLFKKMTKLRLDTCINIEPANENDIRTNRPILDINSVVSQVYYD